MYFPYFLTYIAIGFVLSLAVFWWALHNGQFKDQQRARFLPLEKDRDPAAPGTAGFGRYATSALFFLAFAGLAASAAVLIFALYRAHRF